LPPDLLRELIDLIEEPTLGVAVEQSCNLSI
jgi:hypothetical protein